jgi:alpha-beta hydrolase superfamily lysophospholipase
VFFDSHLMLDLDVYGDIKTANKVIILSHTGTANSEGLCNVYLAEQLYLSGYTVVSFNSQGFRNIITDEPFTGEKKSMKILSGILDNVVDYIRKENSDVPILAGAFSAGGLFLINHFTQNNRNIAGIVTHATFYYIEGIYDDLSYILVFPTIDLQVLYAKNFILSGKFKNLMKIYKAGFDWRFLYKINNNEDFCNDVCENKTNVPIVAIHCKNDTVLSIKSARKFFKQLNSPHANLIEISGVGHSLTEDVIKIFIEQSDELCNNWIENRSKDKE